MRDWGLLCQSLEEQDSFAASQFAAGLGEGRARVLNRSIVAASPPRHRCGLSVLGRRYIQELKKPEPE
jgi:hypothetical protein